MCYLWQRERTERPGGRREGFCRRIHPLDEDRAALASSLSDDGFCPIVEPLEQDHSIGPRDGPHQSGVLVARFGISEVKVEDDAFSILTDEAFDQAGMHRARPLPRLPQ